MITYMSNLFYHIITFLASSHYQINYNTHYKYPERQPNGQWLKSIKFRLPIVEKDIDLCLDNESHTECITALTRMKP